MDLKPKETTFPPTCPMCGLYLERPKELESHHMGEMPVGKCACGAVFSYDISGKNLGQAFIEALVFASNMDWDLAWSLFPDQDYQEELLEHYDGITHQIVPGGILEGRRVRGALYFIRMHKDIREITTPGVEKDLIKARPYTLLSNSKNAAKLSRTELKQAVENYQLDVIAKSAQTDKQILRQLQKLLYSADPLILSRGAEAMGTAAAVISTWEPRAVSTILQALLQAIDDTAASTWGAYEGIGEIIGQAPNFFAGYMPNLYQFLADQPRRPYALKALSKIALRKPELGRKFLFRVLPYFQEPRPECRGLTVWIMGNLQAPEAIQGLQDLTCDPEEITIYQNGQLETKMIGQLALEALQKIQAAQ